MEKYRKICKITVILQKIIEQLKCGKPAYLLHFQETKLIIYLIPHNEAT